MDETHVQDRPGLQKLISDFFFPYELDDSSPRAFDGSSYQSAMLGRTCFTWTDMSRGFLGRRRRQGGPRGERPSYVLTFVHEGAGANLEGGQRRAAIRPGDAVLINSQAALNADVPGGGSQLGLRIDAALLKSAFPQCDDFCLRSLPTESGAGAVLRSTVFALWHQRRACGGEAAASLVEATVRIIGSAFRERHDIPDFGSRTMALHHARLRDAVANRLADPDLSPERLSSEVGLSRSYIHAIMADAGTTLGRLILSMRLEKARDMLADRSMRGRSIADIAFSAGFQDPAHFSRRFSEAYGCAPRAFRAELATGLWAMKS